MSSTAAPVISLEVSFGAAPPDSMVTPLCQSLLELCRPAVGDEDAAARLRMIAHELLENVVKYGAEAPSELCFELRRNADGELEAMVQTRNVPRTENRGDVDARLRALAAAADPLLHYDAVIAASVQRPAGSGLGLARIHAETEYRLSHYFEGDTLCIVARGLVRAGKASRE
jgi:hypothetical protein